MFLAKTKLSKSTTGRFIDMVRNGFAHINSKLRNIVMMSSNVHMREVAAGAAAAVIIKTAAGFLMLLFQVVLARKLGSEGAGRFLLALTCMTFATVLAKAGLDSVLVRYIATGAETGQWRTVRSVARNAILISLSMSMLVAFILFFAASQIAVLLFHDIGLARHIRIMAIAVPFFTIAMLHAEMLRGLKKIAAYQLVQGVIIPGIAVVVFFFLQVRYGEIGAPVAYVIATVVTMIMAIVLWKHILPISLEGGLAVSMGEIIRAALPLLLASSMFFVNGWAATIVLGLYESPKNVALFNAANRIAWITTFILVSVNSIAAPKFAAMYRTGSIQEIEYVGVQTTRLMTLVAAPILISCLAMPSLLLSIFGQEFRDASLALQILAISQIVNVATGSSGQLLLMTGHEKVLRDLISISALMNVILSTILGIFGGLLGVACAVATTTICTSILSVYYVRRYLNIGVHILQPIKEKG